ncbi:MAG: rod shape-determining protein RodA [Thermoanaerobaculia bacterium]|nr:rod shape-determining protein RodA [Thermoanaerobaculia bacterium]
MKSFSKSGPISAPFAVEGRTGLQALGNARWSLLLQALALAVVGLVTIHSASAELSVDYLPRQALWVVLGLGIFLAAFLVDYRRLGTHALAIYGLGVVLLLLTLVAGELRGGARSWLAIGGFGVQPAELAKLTTAVLLAQYLSGIPRSRLRLREVSVAGSIVVLPVTLVALQPDYGSAAMFVPMLLGALLVAGVRWRVLLAVGVLALILGGAAWNTDIGLRGYQKDRILTFLQPERDPLGAGYQVRQSKIAVGSGGLLGQGYMQGTQSQLRFLPARHTDFVFAVLAEEWGFAGVALVLTLFGLFLWGLAEVAGRARDRLGILLIVSLGSILAFHILYNTAMVVGLVPITGIPLPFLSYGGSFTFFCFAATGLALNVDARRYVNR